MPDTNNIPISTVRELLKQQREDFSAMMNTIMKSFQDRYDNMHTLVIDLKHSVEFAHREIDDIKKKCTDDAGSYTKHEEEINNLSGVLETLQDKVDYIENQSRRNNVRFDGVEESPKETWDDTEKKITQVLCSNLNIKKATIERAHRVGPKKPNRTRSIVVKFASYKTREAVLRNRRSLKGTGIFVREDLSDRVLAKQRDQMDTLIEARNRGKIAYFSLDRLIIKDKPPSEVQISDIIQDRPLTRSQTNQQDQVDQQV